jgi:hypothetical protein
MDMEQGRIRTSIIRSAWAGGFAPVGTPDPYVPHHQKKCASRTDPPGTNALHQMPVVMCNCRSVNQDGGSYEGQFTAITYSLRWPFPLPVESHAQCQPDVQLTNEPSISYTSLNQSGVLLRAGVTSMPYGLTTETGTKKYATNARLMKVWRGGDSRRTDDGASSSYPSIAVSGPDVRVVWQDNCSDGRFEFSYKKSSDDGVTLGVDTRFTDNAGESRYPSIATSGSTSHLVWSNWKEARHEIYCKRSINGGVSWGVDIRLTNNTAVPQKLCIAVSSLREVHVVWVDNKEAMRLSTITRHA